MKKISTKDSIRLYKRLIRYIKPYWLLMLLAVLSAVGLAGANTGIAGIVKKVMDDIFVQKNLTMLRLVPLAIVGLYLLKGLFDYFQEYLMGYVAVKVVTDIRDEIYGHLQKLSLAFFIRNPTGILMSRIGNDTNLLQSTVSDSITNFLRDEACRHVLPGHSLGPGAHPHLRHQKPEVQHQEPG
ncbi:MAG: ABC-type multidrug transport system, ATPase and permease component [Deltaproteobacteria bacterium]|nr:ABC-type multidrug transport system, ATPase and permease component [Deltaproteobacteria bacterium]